MIFLLTLLLLSSGIVVNSMKNLKCFDVGCYEVVKVFTELLETKINETDAILAKTESELNEITFGNDENFKEKIKEVDEKLLNLITEINVGVDGGEKTLFELINNVVDDKEKIENLSQAIEFEVETANKNNDGLDENLKNTKEIIRELQDEISRLLSATTTKGPEALQDAFDRSEKFNTNTEQLKEIVDEVKLILRDYEGNLKNVKILNEAANEKFATVSLQVNETLAQQAENEEKLAGIDDLKVSEEKLKSLRKLTDEALEHANKVFEDAFDLLNEITEYELDAKLDQINKKVDKLENYSLETGKSLKKFADENTEFLNEMENTIESAEKVEEKAFKVQEEIENLLKTITGVHENALQAIDDKNELIKNAKIIYNGLEDFILKVEKSRERARSAVEKVPEIIKKIEDSGKIVQKLEGKIHKKTEIAMEAKTKCTKAKEEMDKVLDESEDITSKIKMLEKDFEHQPEEINSNVKEQTRVSDEIDKLESEEIDQSKLIDSTKIKIDEIKSQNPKTEEKVEDILKNIQKFIENIANLKEIDEESLKDFDSKLSEAENKLTESNLNENLKNLKAERHEQTKLIEQYELEIAALENQVLIIKRNAESLENRCFKRTRLEP